MKLKAEDLRAYAEGKGRKTVLQQLEEKMQEETPPKGWMTLRALSDKLAVPLPTLQHKLVRMGVKSEIFRVRNGGMFRNVRFYDVR